MQVRRIRTRLLAAALLTTASAAVAACGGGAGPPPPPSVPPAREFGLAGFTPDRPVPAGRPARVAFRIRLPDGSILKTFARGSGPHTGVHLIIVRKDLEVIIHRHPPLTADGRLAEPITFPTPGPYKVVADVYPKLSGSGAQLRNFQLTKSITVSGRYTPQPLPAFTPVQEVGGYRFTMSGTPRLRALRPAFLTMIVTDPSGRPARFTPFYGALAHAIFFRKGSLDYFHTHVCAPGAVGCTSQLGGAKVTGSSSRPGVLNVGVLLPEAGTWRLFLQVESGGKLMTAPYTLTVR